MDFEYDFRQVGLSKAVEYLLDWSLTDLPIRDKGITDIEAALESLDLDSFNEIIRTIEDHEQRLQALDADQKKITLTGETTSSPTSVSVN
jgi:hypothetical protein